MQATVADLKTHTIAYTVESVVFPSDVTKITGVFSLTITCPDSPEV